MKPCRTTIKDDFGSDWAFAHNHLSIHHEVHGRYFTTAEKPQSWRPNDYNNSIK